MQNPPLAFLEGDAEGGAFAYFGVEHIDTTMVIIADNAFGEREPQSPSALFGGVSTLEDPASVWAVDTLTGVANVNEDMAVGLAHFDGNTAFSFHRIHCVLDEVLYYPCEEWCC